MADVYVMCGAIFIMNASQPGLDVEHRGRFSVLVEALMWIQVIGKILLVEC